MNSEETTKGAWIGEALERYELPLLRHAMRFTRSAETAQDVVQDTFLRLCKADRAKVDGHLAQWLYTVCRNRALDVQKKEARMTPLTESQVEAWPSGGAGPGVVAARHEEHAMVLNVIKTLPDKEQEVFRLKFQDSLTYREISQITGKSLGTVSNLITKALKSIREELGAQRGPAREVQS